jgi:hypothetical protein
MDRYCASAIHNLLHHTFPIQETTRSLNPLYKVIEDDDYMIFMCNLYKEQHFFATAYMRHGACDASHLFVGEV